jgi:hypothetical protein
MRVYGWIGLLLLLVSEYCLFHRIEPFTTYFYCFAWWSYILLADNLLLRLRGRSLLVGRRRELWQMLPLSVFIWLIFEAFNFIIGNWSYTIAPLETWQRWLGYVVSFATVLPGIFVTSELVELLFGRLSGPFASEYHVASPQKKSAASPMFISFGIFLTAAPLIWPKYFFPAVWVGPILLFDPLLEYFGIRSLGSDIFAGNRRRVWSLMLGGLLCGLMWEFWNYWAGSRWIYTIPFFGEWKIFEMPILGFLGFIPFALECWILYHLLRIVPQSMNSAAARIVWWTCLGIVSIIIIRGIDHYTVLHLADNALYLFRCGGSSQCAYACS